MIIRILSFLMALSLCSFCVLAADEQVEPDLDLSDEVVEYQEDAEFVEEPENEEDEVELDSDPVFEEYDSLYVTNLIIEGEEETADIESYSIVDNVQYGSYFYADISYFGEVYIYIPIANSSECFSYNAAGIPINITGSSITGYIAGENSNQAIQFPSFGIPRYRTSSYNDYNYITSWEEINSSVIIYSNEDNFSSYPSSYYLRLIFFISTADLVLNFFIRLLGGMRS